jgi:hypothetical protein
MKLAVNFSDVLLALLKEDPNLPIDYIKVPTESFPNSFEQYYVGKIFRPLLSHVSQPDVLELLHIYKEKRINIPLLTKILELSAPLHLSTHVNSRIEFFPEFAHSQHGYDPKLADSIKTRFLETIQIYRANFQVPLIIENFPYYSFAYECRIGSDPEFISELCRTADCDFLLDISHARVSADFFKMDIFQYLDQLPLQRTKEIHVSGTLQFEGEGFLWDAHTELEPFDYDLLSYVMQKANPKVITIEYGGFPNYQKTLEGGYLVLNRNDSVQLMNMINRIRGGV